jgi:RNA polymerase sigma factor (sigma-70 family)
MATQDWHFRSATAADAERIVALVESAYRGEASKAGWTTEADFLDGQRTDVADVREIIASAGQHIVLCLDAADTLLASAQLGLQAGRAHFGMFAVNPHLQGAGVGKALLQECERRAQTAGCTHIDMWVIWLRESLINFYLRRGYEKTAEQHPFPYGDARFGAPKRDDLYFITLEKALAAAPLAHSADALEAEQLVALMLAIQAGQQQALSQLYERTIARVNGVIARIVRNHADADDVMCEVYRYVWERAHGYSATRGPVIAWLLVIARSRAIDWLRKRRDALNFDVTPLAEIDPSALAEVSEAPDLLDALQKDSLVRQALLSLSAEQRRMIELSFFKDLSHFEIAELTNIPLGTIKSHIRRGQDKLREALIAQGINND